MSEVISNKQADLNRALHDSDDSFGSRADAGGLTSNLPLALSHMNRLGMCSTLLDYGTGKGRLIKSLRANVSEDIEFYGYDPAVERWSQKPDFPVDIVTCLDVLEHVEIQSIDAVFSEIKALTTKFCFLIIDLQPAIKVLADGRNAHVLLAPCDWWVSRVSQHFSSISAFPLLHLIGAPQKLVIVATDNPAITPYMYSFLSKMNLFKMKMAGGLLKKS